MKDMRKTVLLLLVVIAVSGCRTMDLSGDSKNNNNTMTDDCPGGESQSCSTLMIIK